MTAALALAAIAVGSWALRSTFVTFVDVAALPPGGRAALDLVGPAVVAGLVVTAVADGGAGAGVAAPPAQLAGLAAAALVALRTGSLLWPVAGAVAATLAVGHLLG